jgi:hypothetical protein
MSLCNDYNMFAYSYCSTCLRASVMTTRQFRLLLSLSHANVAKATEVFAFTAHTM